MDYLIQYCNLTTFYGVFIVVACVVLKMAYSYRPQETNEFLTIKKKPKTKKCTVKPIIVREEVEIVLKPEPVVELKSKTESVEMRLNQSNQEDVEFGDREWCITKTKIIDKTDKPEKKKDKVKKKSKIYNTLEDNKFKDLKIDDNMEAKPIKKSKTKKDKIKQMLLKKVAPTPVIIPVVLDPIIKSTKEKKDKIVEKKKKKPIKKNVATNAIVKKVDAVVEASFDNQAAVKLPIRKLDKKVDEKSDKHSSDSFVFVEESTSSFEQIGQPKKRKKKTKNALSDQ
ncbi:hypothetical protein A3Q56_00490 [Intoshia linei]|uniref:Uncharacterized protein n=1 Tax=Intoshia linei TaxID=1819745 RepID=A0A177BDS5_9BILA|nr:hypothetical protein A3Q56_00490 [Intoshia linei]